MSSTVISRRDFLARTCCAVALGAGAGACDSGGSAVEDPVDNTTNPPPSGASGVRISGNVITIDTAIGDGQRLQDSGGYLIISAARVIVLNVSGSFRALTAVCTHQGCTVSSFSDNRIHCPCHGSQFNADGSVAQGPAAAPLERFDVSRSGTIITVTT